MLQLFVLMVCKRHFVDANIQAVLNSFTYLFKECVEGLSSFFTVIVFVLWERNAQSVIGCNPACVTCCMLTFFVAYFTVCLRVPITQPGTLSFFLIMERRLEKECEHKMQQYPVSQKHE